MLLIVDQLHWALVSSSKPSTTKSKGLGELSLLAASDDLPGTKMKCNCCTALPCYFISMKNDAPADAEKER